MRGYLFDNSYYFIHFSIWQTWHSSKCITEWRQCIIQGFSELSASTQQQKPTSWNRPPIWLFDHIWAFPKGCRDGAALQFQLRSPLSFQAAQLIPSLSCTYPEEALKYSILSQSIRNWSSCLSSSREEIQFPWSWREAWNLWMNTITNSMKLIINDRERLRGPGWVDRKNKTISPFQIYTEACSP